MRTTPLGRTGLDVSVVGLGLEHMRGQPRETVVSTMRAAVERGVNYFDVIFAMPDYLDHMGEAFRGLRERVLLTAHLGSTDKGGQYYKTRTVKRCESSFLEVLRRLDTEYVDVLMLHNFNASNDWERAARAGYLDLAVRLRDEGKARFLGISGHYHGILERAVESGLVDLIMLPVNLFNHAMPGRGELLDLCARHNVGVVAMKPFGGGKLLNQRGSLRVPKYQTSGETFQVKIGGEVTPVQCLSYVLAQRGVTVALPGVKNEEELAAALHTLEASEAECDFSGLLADFGRYVEGECTYCNHCLPCPVVIDIGQVNRLLDWAELGLTDRACGRPTPRCRSRPRPAPSAALAPSAVPLVWTWCPGCAKRSGCLKLGRPPNGQDRNRHGRCRQLGPARLLLLQEQTQVGGLWAKTGLAAPALRRRHADQNRVRGQTLGRVHRVPARRIRLAGRPRAGLLSRALHLGRGPGQEPGLRPATAGRMPPGRPAERRPRRGRRDHQPGVAGRQKAVRQSRL